MKSILPVAALLLCLVITACKPLGTSLGNDPTPAVFTTNSCIANLIESANFDVTSKQELKPELSAGIPGEGSGAASFLKVSSNAIHLQVERSKDSYQQQLALAIKLAACMDEMANAYFDTEEFRSKAPEEHTRLKDEAFKRTNDYRERVIQLILAKHDSAQGIASKGDKDTPQLLRESRLLLLGDRFRYRNEIRVIDRLLNRNDAVELP